MNRAVAGRVLWPLTERLLGRDTMRRWRSLEASDSWSSEQLNVLRDEKLRRLLKLAAQHCPFYSERLGAAGLDVSDPSLTADALSGLPLLTREEITDHLDEMTWRGGGPSAYSTGGSSGEPLRFFIDRARQGADWAARWRARGWFGVRPGDCEILLWGAPQRPAQADRLRTWRDRLLNQHLLSAFDMSAETMDAYLLRMKARRPACMYGYASSLALLARHAAQREARFSGIKAVFATGEVLLDADRSVIASAFGAPVANEYGSRDGGLLASECPAGLLHIPQENVIVELLDAEGLPVRPGEVGEVVITYLELFAMPLIRYRIGDLARRPAGACGRCACGRASDRLAEVRGRVTDQIVVREGSRVRRMHALSLIYVLREAEGLRQFRINQPSLDRLEVDLVTDERFTPETQNRVEKGLRDRMGDHVAVSLRRCERIAPIASGKHACVVSHCDQHSV